MNRKYKEEVFHDDSELTNKRGLFSKILYSSDIIKPVRDEYTRKLKFIENKKVLDFGCGMGSNSIDMAGKGAIVTGIDISANRIEKAKKRAQENSLYINFIQCDAENTPFEKNSFDIITGNAILHHLNYEESIKEIKRLLKNDGKAVFVEPLGVNPLINFIRIITPKARTEDEQPLKPKDLALFRKYFSEVNVSCFIFWSLLHTPFRLFFNRDIKWLLFILNRLDRITLKLPGLKYLAWQVVLELKK